MKDIISRFLPQNYNDLLSFVSFVFLIPALWIWGDLPETLEGATAVIWVQIGYFYFRRAKKTNKNGGE